MTLQKFRFYCQKVLPLVYDDSLSYYEVLCKVVAKLNETIEEVNTFEDALSEIQKSFDELAETVTELDNLYSTFETTINNRFDALETELTDKIDTAVADATSAIDAKITEIDARVTVLEREVDTRITELETTLNEKFATLTNTLQNQLATAIENFENEIELNYNRVVRYVDEQIEEVKEMIPELQNVHLYDYYSAQLVSLQTAWTNMYNANCSVHGLRAKEFDALGLTAGELDDYLVDYVPRGLKALEWDYKGKILLGLENEKMTHPMTGEVVDVQKVIEFNTDNLKFAGSLSASEFDGLGLSANEIDAKGLTAWQLDWRSNTLLVA